MCKIKKIENNIIPSYTAGTFTIQVEYGYHVTMLANKIRKKRNWQWRNTYIMFACI